MYNIDVYKQRDKKNITLHSLQYKIYRHIIATQTNAVFLDDSR